MFGCKIVNILPFLFFFESWSTSTVLAVDAMYTTVNPNTNQTTEFSSDTNSYSVIISIH